MHGDLLLHLVTRTRQPASRQPQSATDRRSPRCYRERRGWLMVWTGRRTWSSSICRSVSNVSPAPGTATATLLRDRRHERRRERAAAERQRRCARQATRPDLSSAKMTSPAVSATIASAPVLVQQQCGRINWQKAARRLFSSNTSAGLPASPCQLQSPRSLWHVRSDRSRLY